MYQVFLFLSTSSSSLFWCGLIRILITLINLHLLCAHNLGPCRHPLRVQNHRSSQHYSQKAGYYVQPDHDECTIKKTAKNIVRFLLQNCVFCTLQVWIHCCATFGETYGQAISDITIGNSFFLYTDSCCRLFITMASFSNQCHPVLQNYEWAEK